MANQTLVHWIDDAAEADTYEIDGIEVLTVSYDEHGSVTRRDVRKAMQRIAAVAGLDFAEKWVGPEDR